MLKTPLFERVLYVFACNLILLASVLKILESWHNRQHTYNFESRNVILACGAAFKFKTRDFKMEQNLTKITSFWPENHSKFIFTIELKFELALIVNVKDHYFLGSFYPLLEVLGLGDLEYVWQTLDEAPK